jgi:AcrR family transcriptional regulator
MTHATNDGIDPVGTLNRLWGQQGPPRRGPKHALTSAQVVAAAIAIADADADLAQLSMRRVAESLNVGTMSLYTYVASREELVAMMLDTVYAEAVQGLSELAIGSWQDGIRAVADTNWTLFLRHPWALQIFTGRPALGPNAIAKYDCELNVIDGIGLTDIEMDAAIAVVLNHVEGVARSKIEADSVVRRTGITDQQWWETISPAFGRVFDAAVFPIAARVGDAAGNAHQSANDPEHSYSYGLECLIAGIAHSIGAPSADRPGR